MNALRTILSRGRLAVFAAVVLAVAVLAPASARAQNVVYGRDVSNGGARPMGVGPLFLQAVTSNTASANYSPASPQVFTVLASAAQTATFQTGSFTQYDAHGARFFINASTVAGSSPTLTCQLQDQDPLSLNWINEPNVVTPTMTVAGMTLVTVFPALSGISSAQQGSNFEVQVQGLLPQTFRWNCTIGGSSPSFTMSISAIFLN